MTIFKDGRFLAKQPLSLLAFGITVQNSLSTTVTFPEMRSVESIVKVETRQQQATLVNLSITGTPALAKNVAGITLASSNSATVTGEMIVSGY